MNLNNWINLARESWKENNQSLYKELNRSGKLETALREAAELTYSEMAELEAAGHSPQEVWEMTREKYLLLPPEETPDEVENKGAALFNEALDLQSQILRGLEHDIS